MKSILKNAQEAWPERQRSSPSAARNPNMVVVELNNLASFLINNSAFLLSDPAKTSAWSADAPASNPFAVVVEAFRLCARLIQLHITDGQTSADAVPSEETLDALMRAAELKENLEHISQQPNLHCGTMRTHHRAKKLRHEEAIYLDIIKVLTSGESSEYISSTVLFNLALTQKMVKNTSTALSMFDHAFMASALLERHSYGRLRMTREILKNVIDIETTMQASSPYTGSGTNDVRQDGTDDLSILCTNLLETEIEAMSSEDCCAAAKCA